MCREYEEQKDQTPSTQNFQTDDHQTHPVAQEPCMNTRISPSQHSQQGQNYQTSVTDAYTHRMYL